MKVTYSNLIDKIIELINDKKYEFENKYHVEPKYIKIPIWVYEELKCYNENYVASFNPYSYLNMLMGLIVLETPAAIHIEDIEVF